MVTLNLENGNLKIVIDSEESKEELLELLSNEENFWDVLDSSGYIGNNWDFGTPLRGFYLTNTPMIASGVIYNLTNSHDPSYENVWYYPSYQKSSFIEVLLMEGSVEFEKL